MAGALILSQFRSDIISIIAKCPALKCLDIARNAAAMDDSVLFAIALQQDSQLEHLNLCYLDSITDAGITALVKSKCGGRLRVLGIDGCKQLSDDSLIAIRENCKSLAFGNDRI